MESTRAKDSVRLQLTFKNHCMFCLQPQSQQEIHEVIQTNSKNIKNFQPLIHYLTGTDPTFDKSREECRLKRVPLVENLPSICRTCYDVMGELNQLHEQLLNIQGLIQKQTEVARSIVMGTVTESCCRVCSRGKFCKSLRTSGLSHKQAAEVCNFVENLHNLIIAEGQDNSRVIFPTKPPPPPKIFQITISQKSIGDLIDNDSHKVTPRRYSLRRKTPSRIARELQETNYSDSESEVSKVDESLCSEIEEQNIGQAESLVAEGTDCSNIMEEARDGRDTTPDGIRTPNQTTADTAPNFEGAIRSRVKKKVASDVDPTIREKWKLLKHVASIKGVVNGVRKTIAQKCDLCHRVIRLENIVGHLKTHVQDYFVRCVNPSCRLVFSCQRKLDIHIKYDKSCARAAGLDDTKLWTKTCEVCGFETLKQSVFSSHLNIHEDSAKEKNIICPVPNCNEAFSLKQSLENNHLFFHNLQPSPEEQNCSVCKSPIKLKELKTHFINAHGIPETQVVACKYCPFMFHNKEIFIEHLYCHSDATGIACADCVDESTVKFRNRSTLRAHYFKVHNVGKAVLHICQVCNGEFGSVIALRLHKRRRHPELPPEYSKIYVGLDGKPRKYNKAPTHAPPKFPCDLCPAGNVKVCTGLSKLQTHKIRAHGAPPFVCSSCDKTFDSHWTLRNHKRMHIGLQNVNESTTAPTPAMIKCPKENCDKEFRYKMTLQAHYQTAHSDSIKKYYKCDLCDKQFTSSHSLKVHRERVHLGTHQRPICEICGGSFSTMKGLYRHKSTAHSGARKYQCHICSQSFRANSTMTRHIRSHEQKGDNFKPRGPRNNLKRKRR